MEKIYGDHVNLLTIPGEAFFHPGFFMEDDSYMYLDKLTEETEWKQEPIKIFGKTVLQPRFTAFYGDEDVSYTYSGITMNALPWTSTLQRIKENIETAFDTKFNACLLNHYRDGKDYMGWHRDNERNLGKFPVIASVSFGASRIFQFRNYKDKLPIVSIELTHGSLLIMKGETQHYWEHRLPKTVIETQPRINLTFRTIKT
ncbi:alpha-ketoglutarate-dependent dioxygenase AlkB family protein [Pedobacter panaciterrae]|jgi:Alkylated DNA repair protein|uniref:Alpha-ketoglutarate-dependent dioxygenase AlkB n=1 Tax=Pedobacter panaciterrae TaxID=363849 RepID=A0ABU8NL44_9SPHI|nr:alpha-ketoglutarate-dependent dioxygenase AlkB [Pedobacter panaciterrae]NQX52582.1 alpha-ketoglutarate-dependent dioxygenase AlkB [Pedobacter panaciterrae]